MLHGYNIIGIPRLCTAGCGNQEKRGKLFHRSLFLFTCEQTEPVPVQAAFYVTTRHRVFVWKKVHIYTHRAARAPTFVRVYLRVGPVNSIFALNFSHRRALDYIFVLVRPSILFHPSAALSLSLRGKLGLMRWCFQAKFPLPLAAESAALWLGALLSPIRFGWHLTAFCCFRPCLCYFRESTDYIRRECARLLFLFGSLARCVRKHLWGGWTVERGLSRCD